MARRPSLHRPITSRRTPPMPANRCHAVEAAAGDLLFVGQLTPLPAVRGAPAPRSPREQAMALLTHLRDVMAAARLGLDALVRLDLYLVDLASLAVWEAEVPKFFVGQARPVTVVVQVVGLPGGASMALAAVAVRPSAPAAPAPPEGMDFEGLEGEWDEA